MPYVYDIVPNSTDSDGAAVHQSSPSYVLTFVPWVNRVIKEDSETDANFLDTQNPYIVVNDAVSISTTDSLGSPNKNIQIQLVSTDVNYAAAIHPGDYVFLNIVDWEQKSRQIHGKVIERKPINGFHDGFKGLYKIRTVSRKFMINGNGDKVYRYTVTGMAFSELTSVLFYNPAVQAAYNQRGSQGIFMALVGDFYADIAKNKSSEDLIKIYIKLLLGQSQKRDVSIPNYGTTHYKVPDLVSTLLGYKGFSYVNEIYNIVTGLWGSQYRQNNPQEGFNPNFVPDDVNTKGWKAGEKLKGILFKPYENFNDKTIWSILNDNKNFVLNELYTTFRVNPEGSVVPTIVLRQKPYSKTTQEITVTKFKDLPRWRVDPAMVISFDFSTNDALRYNFVQTFVENGFQNDDTQIGLGNFVEDVEDIQRHGIKPYILRSRFGYLESGGKGDVYQSVKWNKAIADMILNSHLKENGTMVCVGLEDPIAVGDNLEFDGNLYHIESVAHNWSISASGNRSFVTTLGLSHGISLSDEGFPELTSFSRRARESKDPNKILPGVGQQQDRRTNTNQDASPKNSAKKQRP